MTCRGGAESAVKEEVARGEPGWRLSYSRTGFLTFKNAGKLLDDQRLAERNWTFAHAHGVSLSKVASEQLEGLAADVWRHEDVQQLVARGELADIHVWQPESIGISPASQAAERLLVPPLCEEIEMALRAAAPAELDKLHPVQTRHRKAAPRNSVVLDVIVLQPGEWWLGYHRAVRRYERWPGGAIPVRMPEHAVSRAYAKMEEAIQWSGLPLAAGDECVEIGCAPGGASQALLDRGLFVTGIDPANVEPIVLANPRFRHLKKRGKDVRRKEFEGVRWLAADMNIAPEATLDEVEAVVQHPGMAIRGMILTLKLSDWQAAARLPELAARVRGWGYREVRTRQLVTGGQEVCLVALRRKALRRMGRKQSRTRSHRHQVESRQDVPQSTLPSPHF
jgi:23S rRNA (cytidine2498-2'-O)-methyltransferase